jgi:hypothetical protein
VRFALTRVSPRGDSSDLLQGTGGLEKSNSASLIPKLRFTEDLRQHNFKQEEFLKEVRTAAHHKGQLLLSHS